VGQALNLLRMRNPMRIFVSTFLSTALAVTAASVLAAGAPAAVAATASPGGRAVIASTVPVSDAGPLTALAAGSGVRLSVFVGRDQTGLAATAAAVSDPANPSYGHYLSPAQVQARFGATAGQQAAVRDWLGRSGLAVTHDDAFVITAVGTTARAEAALQTGLALSRPAGGVEQVVPSRAVSVPAAVAGAITTIQLSPEAVPLDPHQPLDAAASAVTASTLAGSAKTAASSTAQCSVYYGQKQATGLPKAYGRTLTWAPCGYSPAQLRTAYGATKAGLTGAGVTVAVVSLATDPTALSDANHWSRQEDVPQFAAGQFKTYIAPDGAIGGDPENALDIEAVHGTAPAAKVDYVVGNGQITGDYLLDGLDTVVTHRLADVVTSSWYESHMPVPASMIKSWESVLERAAAEGITVDEASGDTTDLEGLEYPGSDPWITSVGGTSLAIGVGGKYLWETGWTSEATGLAGNGKSWSPAAPGYLAGGSTGGVSTNFAEPSYQRGVVSGNIVKGKAMRAVPDVSAIADPGLGYRIGVTESFLLANGNSTTRYVDEVNGGTSLSAPVFAGLEADLIQGRGGKSLGFANPLLYKDAKTATFHDVTNDPQGRGYTEAVIYGPGHLTIPAGAEQPPTLDTMGRCGADKTLSCGSGYDLVTGLGSPGTAFFGSFGSRPK
jgi:subtilase family serine protease